MWKCKHCNQEFNFEATSQKANHSRWCDDNPIRKEYTDKLVNARKSINSENKGQNQFTKAKREGHDIESKIKGRVSTFKGMSHTDEAKKIISEKALRSKHRRLVRNVTEYTKKDGSTVKLDSSWEVTLAERLDELNIEWTRPEPIPWVDDKGISHNYFPDFFIPSKNIYLDPKNEQAFRVQKKKIDILNETYDNIIWIRTLEDCKSFTV